MAHTLTVAALLGSLSQGSKFQIQEEVREAVYGWLWQVFLTKGL